MNVKITNEICYSLLHISLQILRILYTYSLQF